MTPRFRAALDQVAARVAAADWAGVLPAINAFYEVAREEADQLRTSIVVFCIWAQVRAVLSLDRPDEARAALSEALDRYDHRQIRAYASMLSMDLAEISQGDWIIPPVDIKDALDEGDFKTVRAMLAAMYRSIPRIIRQGGRESTQRMISTLLTVEQARIDPVAFYIGLQALRRLEDGADYIPEPLSRPLPEAEPNRAAARFYLNDLSSIPDDEEHRETFRRTEARYASHLDEINEARRQNHDRAVKAIGSCRKDGAPLLLFLRSFAGESMTEPTDDLYSDRLAPGGAGPDIGLINFRFGGSGVEMALGDALPTGVRAVALRNSDNFLGIDTQSDAIPRLALPDTEWRFTLHEVIERSAAVVLWLTDINSGVEYELRCLHELGMMPKLLLIDGRREARRDLESSPLSVLQPEIAQRRSRDMDRLDASFEAVKSLIPNHAPQIIDADAFQSLERGQIADLLSECMARAPGPVCDAVRMDLYFRNPLCRPETEAREILDELMTDVPVRRWAASD